MTHDQYIEHLAKAWNHARDQAERYRKDGQNILAMNWRCDVEALKGCLDAATESDITKP